MATLLEFDDVGKSFGSRMVFRGLTASLSGGECVAVVGPNGSGKSTLLRVGASLMRPTRGLVNLYSLDGSRVAAEQHSRSIGYLAPYVQFYKALSARENLELLRALRGERSNGVVEQVLSVVQLVDRGDDLVGNYSSGMLQRLRLAAAVIHDPPVLLLDEPYANLDEAGGAIVSAVVKERIERGLSALLATNRDDVAGRCDRAIAVAEYAV